MHDNLYANVTARIVAALEKGVAPWIRPWSTVADALPMNAQTCRAYRGVNFTLLSLEATAHGYPLNRWVTYRQALELGGQVRKGERGTTVVFWKLRKVGATADAYPDQGEPDLHERVIPLLRAYTVFNVAQAEGLPAAITATARPAWEPEARAEELLLMAGVVIRHGGALAYYQPRTDETFHCGRRSRRRPRITPPHSTSSRMQLRVHSAATGSWASGSVTTLTRLRSLSQRWVRRFSVRTAASMASCNTRPTSTTGSGCFAPITGQYS
jgi:hypothetical protein